MTTAVLTNEQCLAIQSGEAIPVEVGGTSCVVVRRDVFERARSVADDSWTHEEMNLLADEAHDLIGRGEVDAT